MRKMTWLAGLALGLTLTAGGAEALAADTSSGSVIHTGVYIDGIDVSGMTEAEAHRLIEKQAMDTRATRGEVATSLIEEMEE